MKNEQIDLGHIIQEEDDFSFHEDFISKKEYNHLTVDQLKSRLLAMDVGLDMHKHNKIYYWDLYTNALKDDHKRELIKDILDKDHKLPHSRAKKTKACENFMKNKRKRTEEENTTKEEENNLNLINRIQENPKQAENMKSQDINEIHVYEEEKDINKIESITPEKVFSYKKIKFFSISPSNLSTPAIKETSKIYRDMNSPKFYQQLNSQNLDQFNQLNKFNPLIRTLDADFSKESREHSKETPFRIKIQKFDDFRDNFTFNRILKDNELDQPFREGSFRLVNEEEEMPENSGMAQHPDLTQEDINLKQQECENFFLETSTIPCPSLEIKEESSSNLKENFVKYGKYLGFLSIGAAAVLGLNYLIEESIKTTRIIEIPIKYCFDQSVNILIIGVIAVGVVFLIAYLIKASREAVKRNEEITAENIVNGVKENLLKKIESGEGNLAIDQEEFTQEFCKTNNYKLSYFLTNIMPLVKDLIKNDEEITNCLEENSFYDDGKLRTIWQIRPSTVHLADME